jgi:Mg2+ and Co2+ transporter CorA
MARAPIDDPALLLYRIIDALVDSFFPILADFDDRIEELENQTFLHASRQAAAGDLRHEAAARRYAEGGDPPNGTCFASLMGGVAELPGMTTEAEATSVTSTTT